MLALALNVVEVPIPVYKSGNPLLYGSGRLVAYVVDQIIDIGVGGGNIARLQRKQVFLRFLANPFLNNLDEPGQLNRVVTSAP